MIPTPSIDAFRDTLPDELKDLRLNLSAVLGGENLSSQQAMLVALTSARFLHSQPLVEAVESDIRSGFSPVESIAIISDSIACAGLMAMNTIYYRFRHMIEKESYQSRPARLRMSRMAQPTTSQIDFELASLACAALAGCQKCMQSHEASLVGLGVSEEACHDAVRIAAVMQGVTL